MEPDELEFERDGVAVVHGAFDASGMVDAMWDGLAPHGFKPAEPTTWDPQLVTAVYGQLTKFCKSGRFASIHTATVAETITSLFADEWHYSRGPWGQPLVTFPTPGPWVLPHRGFHRDFPASAAAPLPALRMFAYLSPVAAQGGGTLVIAGSHRLVVAGEVERSPQMRKGLALRSEWFRDLWQPSTRGDRVARFMTEGATVDGVEVRVVELTGQAGDLIVWHPALIHNGSPNCSRRPRFVLTHTAFRGHAPGSAAKKSTTSLREKNRAHSIGAT
jgi:ectoine hydroxylase-related dioxygenase (phytanoyl-CoA dioxygenase family)